MQVDEEHAGITKKQKLKSCISPRPHLPSSSRTVYNFTYLGIINNIELGGIGLNIIVRIFKFRLAVSWLPIRW